MKRNCVAQRKELNKGFKENQKWTQALNYHRFTKKQGERAEFFCRGPMNDEWEKEDDHKKRDVKDVLSLKKCYIFHPKIVKSKIFSVFFFENAKWKAKVRNKMHLKTLETIMPIE